MIMSMRRRNFLSVLGSLSTAAVLPNIARGTAAAACDEAIWSSYHNALVIDSLGSFGDDSAPLSTADLADARSSDLTAINLTVNGASVGSYLHNYEDTVRSLAFFDAQIASHPDVLMQIP